MQFKPIYVAQFMEIFGEKGQNIPIYIILGMKFTYQKNVKGMKFNLNIQTRLLDVF